MVYAVQAFARLFPARLAGAVLLCTKASADPPEVKARREANAQAALAHGAGTVLALVDQLVAPGAPAALRAHVRALCASATAQGIADAQRGMALRPDSTPSLARWTWPTLVVAGAHDQIIPAAETDALAAAIPGCEELVAPGGHLAFLEAPEAVTPALLALLRRAAGR